MGLPDHKTTFPEFLRVLYVSNSVTIDAAEMVSVLEIEGPMSLIWCECSIVEQNAEALPATDWLSLSMDLQTGLGRPLGSISSTLIIPDFDIWFASSALAGSRMSVELRKGLQVNNNFNLRYIRVKATNEVVVSTQILYGTLN